MSHSIEKFYFKRTVEHIHRVQNNMLLLVTKYKEEMEFSSETCRKLVHNVMNHDRSKFNEVQFLPYIELTEFYRQRKTLGNNNYQYPDNVKDKISVAVENHYKNENHHPEMYDKGGVFKWSLFNSIECACDLQAMAQEYNEGSCRKYWGNVWLKNYTHWFYDDFNWEEIKSDMDRAITCFEKEVK